MNFRSKNRVPMTAAKKEARRRKAIDLIFKKGIRRSEVARMLGVTRAAVSKWVTKHLDDDIDGLKSRQRSVNSPVLVFFLEPLLERLAAGAMKLGFADARWTTQRLQELLNRMTGLGQDRMTVKRTMNRIGWYYDPKSKSWKADPHKHAEALASLKGRCVPPKFRGLWDGK